MTEPTLSVVVGSVESALSIDQALSALQAAVVSVDAEVLVIDASRDDSAERAERHSLACRVVRRPPGTLVPLLWAEGIRLSRGRYVALTTGHCIPPVGWAEALREALHGGAAAAGAGVELRSEAGAVDRAVFFLRYGGFLTHSRGPDRRGTDVPGDNAAYHGDPLRTFVAENPHGFWEVDFHNALISAGSEIRIVPRATVGFGRAFPFWVILSHRWRHGRHFGHARVRGPGRREARWRVVLAAPLVPVVLLLRNARRLRGHTGYGWRLASAVVPFMVLASAWAAGEAVGALLGPGRPS